MDARLPADPVSPQDAARLLNVSGTTIRNWIAAGKMPAVRVGGRLWMDRQDVLAKVERVQPVAAPAVITRAEAAAREEETARVLRQAGIE